MKAAEDEAAELRQKMEDLAPGFERKFIEAASTWELCHFWDPKTYIHTHTLSKLHDMNLLNVTPNISKNDKERMFLPRCYVTLSS